MVLQGVLAHVGPMAEGLLGLCPHRRAHLLPGGQQLVQAGSAQRVIRAIEDGHWGCWGQLPGSSHCSLVMLNGTARTGAVRAWLWPGPPGSPGPLPHQLRHTCGYPVGAFSLPTSNPSWWDSTDSWAAEYPWSWQWSHSYPMEIQTSLRTGSKGDGLECSGGGNEQSAGGPCSGVVRSWKHSPECRKGLPQPTLHTPCRYLFPPYPQALANHLGRGFHSSIFQFCGIFRGGKERAGGRTVGWLQSWFSHCCRSCCTVTRSLRGPGSLVP